MTGTAMAAAFLPPLRPPPPPDPDAPWLASLARATAGPKGPPEAASADANVTVAG